MSNDNNYQSSYQSLDVESDGKSHLTSGPLLNDINNEDPAKLFTKETKFSRGFVLGVSSLVLVSIGLLALSAHSGIAENSMMAGRAPVPDDKKLIYQCKSKCVNPCSMFKSRDQEYCCEWSSLLGQDAHTCAITINNDHGCFCTANLLNKTALVSGLKQHYEDAKSYLDKRVYGPDGAPRPSPLMGSDGPVVTAVPDDSSPWQKYEQFDHPGKQNWQEFFDPMAPPNNPNVPPGTITTTESNWGLWEQQKGAQNWQNQAGVPDLRQFTGGQPNWNQQYSSFEPSNFAQQYGPSFGSDAPLLGSSGPGWQQYTKGGNWQKYTQGGGGSGGQGNWQQYTQGGGGAAGGASGWQQYAGVDHPGKGNWQAKYDDHTPPFATTEDNWSNWAKPGGNPNFNGDGKQSWTEQYAGQGQGQGAPAGTGAGGAPLMGASAPAGSGATEGGFGNWQQYTQGGASSNFQKFTQQGGGPSSSGQWQQYTQGGAGSGAGNWQQYTQGGAGSGAGNWQQYTQGGAGSGAGNWQQYTQGGGGASGAGNWQQYMKGGGAGASQSAPLMGASSVGPAASGPGPQGGASGAGNWQQYTQGGGAGGAGNWQQYTQGGGGAAGGAGNWQQYTQGGAGNWQQYTKGGGAASTTSEPTPLMGSSAGGQGNWQQYTQGGGGAAGGASGWQQYAGVDHPGKGNWQAKYDDHSPPFATTEDNWSNWAKPGGNPNFNGDGKQSWTEQYAGQGQGKGQGQGAPAGPGAGGAPLMGAPGLGQDWQQYASFDHPGKEDWQTKYDSGAPKDSTTENSWSKWISGGGQAPSNYGPPGSGPAPAATAEHAAEPSSPTVAAEPAAPTAAASK